MAISVKYLVLIAFSLFLGFLSAIPVGAVQLEVARKALNGYLSHAMAVAFGSATSDFIYGVLTLFGFGNFLLHKESQIFIYVVGIAVLCFLFYRSFREFRHEYDPSDSPLVYKKRISFLTGFSIAITNPGIIIWWIIGFKLLADLDLFAVAQPSIKLIFILSSVAGLGGYLMCIAIFLHRMHKAVPDKYIDRMNIVVMVLFVILIAYFSLKLLSIILNRNLLAAVP
jgi:threonine/homoserine/homoserine lactone efflux protein